MSFLANGEILVIDLSTWTVSTRHARHRETVADVSYLPEEKEKPAVRHASRGSVTMRKSWKDAS